MTFLQVWVAAVRESRKLRNQPKTQLRRSVPAHSRRERCHGHTLGAAIRQQGWCTVNSKGSYTRHQSRSDNEKTIPATHRPPVHENRRNSKESSETFAPKTHSDSASKNASNADCDDSSDIET